MIESEITIAGIKKILSKFSTQDVIALCSTVTQGMLKKKVLHRDDAIEAIIKYSTDTCSCLRRKLITRSHLFEYAHETGIEIKIPSTKEELIENIIQYWGCEVYKDGASSYFDNSITQSATNTSSNSDLNATIDAECSSLSTIQEQLNDEITIESTSIISKEDFDMFSHQFTDWFYKLLNSNAIIDTDHFYPNASLQIRYVNNEMTMIEEARCNTHDVVHLLYKVKQNHGLYFNPNLSMEGSKVKMDPHGLLMVLACGTLHINNMISGLFEQMFLLARDPFQNNNWKIKSSKMVLNSGTDTNSMSQLCHEELLQIEDA